MPEGDTIRRLADHIARQYLGQTATQSLFRHPRFALHDLTGRMLENTDARGKHLYLHFSGDVVLHVHLRLAGSVTTYFPRRTPDYRRRFEIKFEQGWLCGIDTPVMELIAPDAVAAINKRLGPDTCGAYDHQRALANVASAEQMPISGALLDQNLIAGLGNIYAVETPFVVGLSPWTPVGEIDDLSYLIAIAVGLIRSNARRGPQNTTGRRLERNDHWVLNRRIRRCKVCGNDLIRQGPSETAWGRRTAWCPTCQATDQTTVDRTRAAKLLAMHPCRTVVDLATGSHLVATTSPVETLPSQRRSI